MKRFISVLLVAILIVTSLSVAAYAALPTANPGDTVTIPVTVSGNFGNYHVVVTSTSVLTITGISGDVTANPANGNVAWAAADNVSSHTFYVTVKVADDAPAGEHYIGASLIKATMKVPMEEDTDGILDGWVTASCSVAGGVQIVIPECDHSYGDWVIDKDPTCTEDGLKHKTCEHCGDVVEERIPALGHDWVDPDCENPGYCAECGAEGDAALGHDFQYSYTVAPTETEWGYDVWVCSRCGDIEFRNYVEPGMDPVYPTGDITPVIALFCLVCIGGVSLLVLKRRNFR